MTRTEAAEKAATSKDKDAKADVPEDETPHQKAVREAQEAEAEAAQKEQERAEQAEQERVDDALANVPDPENPEDVDKFNSHLLRDTTHFQNQHYDASGPVDKITGGSSANRVEALQALLRATGANVQSGVGWDYATHKAVMDFQGEGATGDVDRETWDKLSDILFGKGDESKGKKEPKAASVPQGQ
jgi:hypothetical protein